MTSLNRPARLNRTLLAVIGLALLGAGGFALATSLGWLRLLDRSQPLVPGDDRPPTWVLYVTVVAAVVLGLLFLRWLAAQAMRRPKTRTWRLEDDPAHGVTKLSADAAVAPFESEIAAYPQVRSADATLSGPQDRPTLLVTVTAEPGTDLSALREHIAADGVARLKQALDLAELPAVIEFRIAAEAAVRVI
ncbi:alkaline shock response membrane anchor protein AmaP [Amycolatopsis tucumanensis]|uniref:alkaline shock response membrane anchor protein AmaP n=1 Tax=Amycolatopsis tucumanensis TaxID=401106 RepID=UPI003D72A79E